MIAVPNPEDYDVSLVNGFLPDDPPLEHLPDPYYAQWEFIVKNLQGLILSKRLHEVVDRLPVLSTNQLLDEAQWRRAYSVLAFIAHAYIWGGDKAAERIPPPITIPFLATCRHLELPPVATYAGLVLWNWKPIFDSEAADTLTNLDTIETFTGSLDEKWFYLISTAIESRGGPIIPIMLRAIQAARYGHRATVTECLQSFAERLDELAAMLGRMHDNCDPHVFYHRIRPFLAGSKNMAQAGLPNGVIFDNGGPINKQRYVQYSGGSNAQSSIIQFFDLVLGVEHHPTGPRPSPSGGSTDATTTEEKKREPGRGKSAGPTSVNFIHEMRKYMPGPHARFLQQVAAVSNLRPFVQVHSAADPALRLAFDACLAMLSRFRDAHIQIVSRYIIVQSRKAVNKTDHGAATAAAVKAKMDLPSHPKRSRGTDATLANATDDGVQGRTTTTKQTKRDLTGTGGTSLIPFLRQARDETGSSAIDAWTRRLLVKDRRLLRDIDDDDDDARTIRTTDAVPPKVQGLAGMWRQDGESWGGLCQF